MPGFNPEVCVVKAATASPYTMSRWQEITWAWVGALRYADMMYYGCVADVGCTACTASRVFTASCC